MAFGTSDRVREQVSGFPGGTGALTLTGTPVSGFQSFLSGWGASGTGWYCIVEGTQWEVGFGTLNAGGTTLTRTTVFANMTGGVATNVGATAINFAAGTLDVFGDIPAFIAQYLNMAEITVASAGTCDIGSAQGSSIAISGVTTITSFGTVKNQRKFVRFTGAMLLTHNATTLILPGSANITTVAGDTAVFVSDASGNWRCVSYQRGTGVPVILSFTPQGRLTLPSQTPVMNSTFPAKTTFYYTPYVGNMIPIYDGTLMIPTVFAEISVLTTDTAKNPAAIGASKVNDWFVWNDAGTMRLSHGPDWTSDILRSAGTALVMVNGILLNSVTITNGPAASRGTYVGTTRSNASSQLDWIYGALAAGGTSAFFGIWNMYNRVTVATAVRDSTDTWTSTSSTFRAANNSATARVFFVVGLDEDAVEATYFAVAAAAAATNSIVGVGLDVVNAFTGGLGFWGSTAAGSEVGNFRGHTGIGFHFVAPIEKTEPNGNTSTWWGDGGSGYIQTSFSVLLRM